MLENIYIYYRTFQIEGIIHFLILSYALYQIFEKSPVREYDETTNQKDGIACSTYTLSATLLLAIISYSLSVLFSGGNLDTYNSPPPYWLTLGVAILGQILFSWFLLSGRRFLKVIYILFFYAFIQLFKVICSPLYNLESSLSHSTYILFDFGSGLALIILLVLLTMLFRKYQLHFSVEMPRSTMLLSVLFPLLVLVGYGIFVNHPILLGYLAPLTAIIILVLLPISYRTTVAIAAAYEEQRRMDIALMSTKAQLSHYRYSIVLDEKIKKERHELKNHYFYIQTLLKENKIDVLNDYIDNEIGEKLQDLSEIHSGNTMMDYILNTKIHEARKKNIKAYAEVIVPAELNISEDALCTILLNLLDNAIEASAKVDDPDLHITINCVKQYLTCTISNKVQQNVLMHNPQFITTKKDRHHHGFGMKIIKDTVEKYNGILNISNDDSYFTVTVMLPLTVKHTARINPCLFSRD